MTNRRRIIASLFIVICLAAAIVFGSKPYWTIVAVSFLLAAVVLSAGLLKKAK